LRALRLKKRLRYFEERIAVELIAAGYARRDEDMLVATPQAIAALQTPITTGERPTNSR
jgi:hypothetical protein